MVFHSPALHKRHSFEGRFGRVSFDKSLRTESIPRSPWEHGGPMSLQSMTPDMLDANLQEATAVSIYPHTNKSLLVIQHSSSSSGSQSHSREASAVSATEVNGRPLFYIQPTKVLDYPTPPTVRSPLQDPREAPAVPVLSIIPPTPARDVEDASRLIKGTPTRSRSLLQRARQYSDSVLRTGSLRRTGTRRRMYDRDSDSPARREPRENGLDADAGLHPMWRPREFWNEDEQAAQGDSEPANRDDAHTRRISQDEGRNEEDKLEDHDQLNCRRGGSILRELAQAQERRRKGFKTHGSEDASQDEIEIAREKSEEGRGGERSEARDGQEKHRPGVERQSPVTGRGTANTTTSFNIILADPLRRKARETTFQPTFTYPIFGDEEAVFGYKNLQIELKLTADTLAPSLDVSWDDKYEAVGDTEADDVEGLLAPFVPSTCHHTHRTCVGGGECAGRTKHANGNTDRRAALNDPQSERTTKPFKPPGELIHSYTLSGREYGIWQSCLAETETKELLRHAQVLVPLFIEGGTALELDDDQSTLRRWTVFFL
ncbi:hypothetical protein MRB53_037933 [Persea americana]|nr:hypothetical protein MRB53_037933 [Persea americana]